MPTVFFKIFSTIEVIIIIILYTMSIILSIRHAIIQSYYIR